MKSNLSLLTTTVLCLILLYPAHIGLAQQGWYIQSPPGAPSLRSLGFSDQMNGYASGSGTILKTSDGGETWLEALPEYLFNLNFNSVYTHSPDTAFALSPQSGQVLRTFDGGESWAGRSLGQGWYYKVAGSPSGTLLAVGGDLGQGVIARSDNFGEDWTQVFSTDGPEFLNVHFTGGAFAWAVGAFDLIARSETGGQTWEIVPIDVLPGERPGPNSVGRDVFFLDDDIGWIALYKEVFRTQDGGLNWEQMGSIETSERGITSIWFTSPMEGWLSADTEIYRTNDGGASWNPVGLETPVNPQAGDITEFFFLDPDLGWAVGGTWNASTGVIVHYGEGAFVSVRPETPSVDPSLAVFPNPMRQAASVSFTLDQAEKVSVDVFDILGRHTQTLIHRTVSPGEHRVRWDRGEATPGLYLLRLRVGATQTHVRTVVLD